MAAELEMSLDKIIKSKKIGFRHRDGAKKKDNGAVDKRRSTQSKTEFRATANRQISKPEKRTIGNSQQRKFIQNDVNGDRNQRGGNGGKIHLIRQAVKEIQNSGPAKMMVSNLNFNVTSEDLIDLFGQMGPLKSTSVHYDRFGRSLGTADIVFEQHEDAFTMMTLYNGIPLDGRPMKIRLTTSEVLPDASTVAVPIRNNQAHQKQQKQKRKQRKQQANDKKRNIGNHDNAMPITIEDLEAELDACAKEVVDIEFF